jgi:hypothetical protein
VRTPPGAVKRAISRAVPVATAAPKRRSRSGRKVGSEYGRFIKAVLSWHGDRCHICGCGGARTVDHVVSVSAGGAEYDMDNARPAHGWGRTNDNPCARCSDAAGRPIRCNQIKGDSRTVERTREIISGYITANGRQPPAGFAGTQRSPGREW